MPKTVSSEDSFKTPYEHFCAKLGLNDTKVRKMKVNEVVCALVGPLAHCALLHSDKTAKEILEAFEEGLLAGVAIYNS